jgi:positive regulator of sigma E activity
MKTVEQIGRVVDVTESKAEVLVRAPGEGGCGAGCSCCGSASGGSARRIYVNRGDLNEGDYARIEMPACSGYLSALVVFVLPMVLVIVGMMIGGTLEQGSGRDMPTLIGGAAGFALAIGIAILVNKTITGEGNFHVERITEEQAREGLQGSSCSIAPE